MRTLLAALICLMLFATPVVAGDLEDGIAGNLWCDQGDFKPTFRWRDIESPIICVVTKVDFFIDGAGCAQGRR